MIDKIDAKRDPLHPLVVAIAEATGRRVHLATALRWCQHGRHGVRLQSWMCGGRRMTTIDAVREFLAATTAATDRGRPSGDRPATPKQRAKQIAAAEKALKEMGV